MNAFLCHTPLHLLISTLALSEVDDADTLFIVVEDVQGLHSLASAVLATSNVRFMFLPGVATTSSRAAALKVQKDNFNRIRVKLSGLTIDRVFIFFDQRAEAQALLNWKFDIRPVFSLLEDGITTYNVATPFTLPIVRQIRHKIIFDRAWKGSKWIGQHPAIEEVWCFYPDSLRDDLKKKRIRSLPRSLDENYIASFRNFYGPAKFSEKTGIIVVPHHDSGVSERNIDTFISKSIAHIHSMGARPVLKFHPRDELTIARITNERCDVDIAQQFFPIELLLIAEKRVTAITGYRTSALHVTSAILPTVLTFYFEPESDAESEKWAKFFLNTSVRKLIL
jgi:hypothetical protein